MECSEHDPGPGHPEKLRLKVAQRDCTTEISVSDSPSPPSSQFNGDSEKAVSVNQEVGSFT